MKSIGLTFGKELRARLTQVLGGKISIYPIVAEETSPYPYVAYQRDNLTLGATKDGYHQETCQYTINIYTGNDYAKGVDLADKVIDTITDWQHINDQRLNTNITNTTETYIADSYLQSLTIEISIDRY